MCLILASQEDVESKISLPAIVMCNCVHDYTLPMHALSYKLSHTSSIVLCAGQPMAGAGPISNVAMSGREHAELQQSRRREAELATRVAALEAKVKSGSSVQGEMQQSVQEISHRLQVALLSTCFAGR